MDRKTKNNIILFLVAAVVVVMAAKRFRSDFESLNDELIENKGKTLPTLVEFGSTTCMPCRKMHPILEDIKAQYAGQLKVRFVDVRKKAEKAREYGIGSIPTQVFLSSDGMELFRHVGFWSKEHIVDAWRDLDVPLSLLTADKND